MIYLLSFTYQNKRGRFGHSIGEFCGHSKKDVLDSVRKRYRKVEVLSIKEVKDERERNKYWG